jgi:hypothetical protein
VSDPTAPDQRSEQPDLADLNATQMRILAAVPSGAVTVAGTALLLLLIAWLLIYLLVYLPRGTVG